MPLFEAVFKVKHDCPFGNISEKFPSLRMFIWCNREHEIIEMVIRNPEDDSAIMDEFLKHVNVLEKSSDENRTHLVTTKCTCTLENSVVKNIDAFNLLHISPVIYERGWEYYRVIAFRHRDLQKLLQLLGKRGFAVEVLRKFPFEGFVAGSFAITTDALFSGLTKKQIHALLTSYRHGYYKLPRKSSLTAIVKNEHAARTTFEEHLRKAENKLVESLIPYLQLFEKIPPEKRSNSNVGG